VSKRTELAAQFIGQVSRKQFEAAVEMLAEDVQMVVPQVGTVPGRHVVEAALRVASESGRGFERVSWSKPLEQEDGTVLIPGKAPTGLLGLIAKLAKKQVKLNINLTFAENDEISKVDVVVVGGLPAPPAPAA